MIRRGCEHGRGPKGARAPACRRRVRARTGSMRFLIVEDDEGTAVAYLGPLAGLTGPNTLYLEKRLPHGSVVLDLSRRHSLPRLDGRPTTSFCPPAPHRR